MRSMTLQPQKQQTALVLLSLGGFILLCFLLMSTVFGVPAIVTTVIFACFLVVLASAFGCALSIRAIELTAEEEELANLRKAVEDQIHLVNTLILNARSRISNCEQSATEESKDRSIKNLLVAKRVVNALEIRLNKLLALIASDDPQQIRIAKELSELPLVVPEDKSAPAGSGDRIPELLSGVWEDTLTVLLSQAEQELKQSDIAA